MGKRGRGAAQTRGRSRGATPGQSKIADIPGPAPRIKLKTGQASKSNQHGAEPVPFIGFEQQETAAEQQDEVLVTEQTIGMRRSGRRPKKRQDDYFAFGSELEHYLDLNSQRKADGGEDEEFQNMKQSSPPGISFMRQMPCIERQSVAPPAENHSIVPFLGNIDREDFVATSHTLQPSSDRPEHRRVSSTFKADDTVYQVMQSLCGTSKVFIDLPTLENPTGGQAEIPYTATFLTHLYILAYNATQYNLCDLVADTWIRALHVSHRRAEKNAKDGKMIWRPNEALTRRVMVGKKGFDENAPNWSQELHIEDPPLDPNVVNFSDGLLHQLYEQTRSTCGARLLWADAMALCGSKLEIRMQNMRRHGELWHPVLVHNILCTSLRMVRRKLTLKIEESTEGAWCKRYHEHYKHGQPCYLQLAYERKRRSEDTSDADEDEDEDENEVEDGIVQGIEAQSGRGEKRVLEDADNYGLKMGDAKRVRLGNYDVVDVDAEGESEDE